MNKPKQSRKPVDEKVEIDLKSPSIGELDGNKTGQETGQETVTKPSQKTVKTPVKKTIELFGYEEDFETFQRYIQFYVESNPATFPEHAQAAFFGALVAQMRRSTKYRMWNKARAKNQADPQ